MRYLCSQARLEGDRAALDRVGVTYDEELVAHGNFHHASGLAGAARPLAMPARPTAIVAGNDEQAAGVYTAAARAGLRVPHDLSVVGFDDVPMVQWVSPALTTVRQPIAELAALAVRTLIGHLDGVALPPGRIESTALVVRGSTAPPPA